MTTMETFSWRFWFLALVFIAQGVWSFTDATSDHELAERANYPTQSYHSSPAKHVKLKITKSGGSLAPGYLIISPQSSGKAPLIMTNDGDLVWAGDERGNNFRVQQLKGKDILTYYIPEAYSGLGFFYGSVSILDRTYTRTHHLCPRLDLYIPKFKTLSKPPKCQADVHESEVTADGTLLVTAYNVTRADLSSVFGPKNGWAIDGQFHEIDIATGKTVFKWKSLDHVAIKDTHVPLLLAGRKDTLPFDYFHINSVQKIGKRYLVSSRQTWSLYLIDSDGSIVWTFNGQDGGDFAPLPGSMGGLNPQWGWQHTAKIIQMKGDTVVVTLFNNNNRNSKAPTAPSSGFSYELNTKSMTSKVLRDLRDPTNLAFSDAEGSYQKLPNDNVLLAYGNYPSIQEFGPSNNSDVRLTIKYGAGARPQGATYRAYKSMFHGLPKTVPSVATSKQNGVGYVSWNGDMDTTDWVVYAGSSKKKLKQVAKVPKKGFEASFHIPKGTKYIRVDAHDGSKVLAKSAVKSVGS